MFFQRSLRPLLSITRTTLHSLSHPQKTALRFFSTPVVHNTSSLPTNLLTRIRKETGISIGKIKKAIDSSGGSYEKAMELLQEEMKLMGKKRVESGRECKEGTSSVFVVCSFITFEAVVSWFTLLTYRLDTFPTLFDLFTLLHFPNPPVMWNRFCR